MQGAHRLNNIRLNSITHDTDISKLESMVLNLDEISNFVPGLRMVNEGILTNRQLAESGFHGDTEDYFSNQGRKTGFMREFGINSRDKMYDGDDFVVGCVAHSFDNDRNVNDWMEKVFLKRFIDRIGELIGINQKLVDVKEMLSEHFFDHSLAVNLIEEGPEGEVSFTIIDFKIGTLLGVCFVGTKGTYSRIELCEQIGLALEQKMVTSLLG